jgi:hypothetical protein
MQFILKENRARNQFKSMTAMQSALVAHDRILAISTEIRKRHGLEPLGDSQAVKLWRAKVDAAPALRKASAKRQADLSGPDWVADVARRRRKIDAERLALDAEIKAMVERKAIPVSRIASALGISRQRIYQLAA